MVKVKTFKNGLRLIVKKIDGLLSVTSGVMVAAGSVDEDEKNNGISHFIEHMLFKGTKNRTAFEISDGIDKIGAQINAYTTKEMTCYYTKSTAEHVEKSLEILADLFFNSLFDEEEIKREKGVVLEEISMSFDTPDDLCLDTLSEAYYGNEGLGRTILGGADNVNAVSRADILKYMEKNYYPQNIVISIAGNIDYDDAVKYVERYFAEGFNASGAKQESKPDKIFSNHLFIEKDIEQQHIALAMPAIEFNNGDTNALSLANIVLGGGMSSRLFQKVREQLGLAYTVYSYLSAYQNSGIMTVYAGISPKNRQLALDSITDILAAFKRDKLTVSEFERGKEQLKSAFVMGQESTASQMMLYGKYLLFGGTVFDFEEKIKRISAVTHGEVCGVIDKYFDISLAASACVGKDAAKLF